eukprot:14992818-Ditylum_brightwellii.AAC.1
MERELVRDSTSDVTEAIEDIVIARQQASDAKCFVFCQRVDHCFYCCELYDNLLVAWLERGKNS